jgi:hypothetical protein
LPHQDDHSDEASILPQSDLNPLLNPLLEQNMGRWAEVYFTSTPEKREQALLDLLHELRAENAAREAALSAPVAEQASLPLTENAGEILGMRAARMRCAACGRENPASHRFCGICGTAVLERSAANDARMADLHTTDLIVADREPVSLECADLEPIDLNRADLNAIDVAVEDHSLMYPRREEHVRHESAHREAAPSAPGSLVSSDSRFVTFENAPFESPMRTNESWQPPGGSDEAYHAGQTGGILDPEPASASYRIPLVIVLAFVLLALGYMTWRSMQTADSSHSAAPATQSTAAPPEPTTSSSPSTVDTPDAISPAGNQAVDQSSDATDSRSKVSPSEVASAKGANSPAAQMTLIPKRNPQAETVSRNGSEELAMAQRYLNGAAGQERDSAEAAKWLWKAIAKHNGEASLLLSDLYLKGDGVGKNCDQARVLLDSAAVRGVTGAAERLRQLQAFGCS